MQEVDASELQKAVEHMHGATATLVQSVPVSETFNGAEVWTGVVHVFDLVGHPTAVRAYAWSSPVTGTERRKFYAVLKAPPIESPLDAIRASIVAEARSRA